MESYLTLELLADEQHERRLQEIENARLIRLASISRPDLRDKLLLLLGERLIAIGSSIKNRYSQRALDSRCQAYFARSKHLQGSNRSEVAIRMAPKCDRHVS